MVRVKKDRFVIFCMLGNYWFARKEWREKEPVRGGGGRWDEEKPDEIGRWEGVSKKPTKKNQRNWEVGGRTKKTVKKTVKTIHQLLRSRDCM